MIAAVFLPCVSIRLRGERGPGSFLCESEFFFSRRQISSDFEKTAEKLSTSTFGYHIWDVMPGIPRCQYFAFLALAEFGKFVGSYSSFEPKLEG